MNYLVLYCFASREQLMSFIGVLRCLYLITLKWIWTLWCSDCLNCGSSLVCLNLCLGASEANGEHRQRSACPIATHPPVRAIMGNIEHHSFNFILSTTQATRHNVIISSRSAGSSDRAMLSRHWGNANWFHISYGIFKASTCNMDCHFRQRYENQREMSNCGGSILFVVCCLLWSLADGTRYLLMPRCQQTF